MHMASDKRQIYPVRERSLYYSFSWQVLCILNRIIKIISIMKHTLFFAFVFLLTVSITSCNSNGNASSNNKSEDTASTSSQSAKADNYGNFTYDLAKPAAKWVLPNELKEISGNTWIDKDHLLV